MNPKNAVYAAVGAPIVAAKALNVRLETLRGELGSRTEGLSEKAQKVLEEWTNEGRQAVEKVSDGKVVDELAARVDFDQAREQVGKLRDQLEEMLATWRTSFRPETVTTDGPVAEPEQGEEEKATPVEPAAETPEQATDTEERSDDSPPQEAQTEPTS